MSGDREGKAEKRVRRHVTVPFRRQATMIVDALGGGEDWSRRYKPN